MKLYIIKAILVLFFLAFFFTLCQSQRGGGSSVSRSSGSGSSGGSKFTIFGSRYRSSRFGNFTTKIVNQIIGFGTGSEQIQSFNQVQYAFLCFVRFLIAATILFIGYQYRDKITNLFKAQQPDNREANQKQAKRIVKDFTHSKERQPSSQSQKNIKKEIQSMKKKTFTMTFQDNKKKKKCVASMRYKNSKRFFQQHVYSLTFEGSDEIGQFLMQGYMAFAKQDIEFCLMKQYADKEASGQIGNFQCLLYQGSGDIGECQGTWKYVGHDSQVEYNGAWTMNSQSL